MDRYVDREFKVTALRLQPGEYHATSDGTALSTLLGSCVSVCLYDTVVGVGGMNHFMLPEQAGCSGVCGGKCSGQRSGRYGSCAIPLLIEGLHKLGAMPSRLQAKVFGAGRVMKGMADIGEQNAAFALAFLAREGIPVVGRDLGSPCPRRIFFYPKTGVAYVKRMRELGEEPLRCQ